MGRVVRGGIEDLRGVASGNGWLAAGVHAARVQVQVSAQGRGAQQRGDARAAGGVEARALEIAGRGARARGGALRQEERLVPRMGEAAGGAGRGAVCAAVRGRRAPAGAGGEARALGDRGGDARARARGGALRVDKRAQAAEACLLRALVGECSVTFEPRTARFDPVSLRHRILRGRLSAEWPLYEPREFRPIGVHSNVFCRRPPGAFRFRKLERFRTSRRCVFAWGSRRAVSIDRLFQRCRISSSTELKSGASPITM